CFFFFQAEDGIRDFHVTGVQTCALPICGVRALPENNAVPGRVALQADGVFQQVPDGARLPRQYERAVVQRLAHQEMVDEPGECRDRKSTRLNSSHVKISYAVFCLKKKIK